MAKIPVAREQAAIYVQKDGYTLTQPFGEMYFLLTIREVPFAPKLFAGTKNGDGTTTHGSCALYETSACTLRPHRGYGA